MSVELVNNTTLVQNNLFVVNNEEREVEFVPVTQMGVLGSSSLKVDDTIETVKETARVYDILESKKAVSDGTLLHEGSFGYEEMRPCMIKAFL